MLQTLIKTLTPVLAGATLAAAVSALPGQAQAGQTLDAIRQKGYVQCGVHSGLAGFGTPGSKGEWTGFDVDFCRAVAAATLGDAKKVKFTPLSAQQRFTALQSGEIDVLSRNTTVTLTRDASLGLTSTAVTKPDGPISRASQQETVPTPHPISAQSMPGNMPTSRSNRSVVVPYTLCSRSRRLCPASPVCNT